MQMRPSEIAQQDLPLISIIIPIYKVGPFVRKTLESVAAQTYPNIETIIINDATPDDSMTVVRRSLKGVPNPHIIELLENSGLGNARNVGLTQALGEYVFFLDSDDWLDPQTIEKAVAKAQQGDAQVVVIDFYKVNHDKRTRAKDRRPYNGAKFDVFNPGDEQSVLHVFNLAQIKLYKKDFLKSHKFRFKSGIIYEDVDWTFKIMMTAERVAIVNEPLYFYRTARPGSILTTKGSKHFDVLEQYEDVFTFMRNNNKEKFLETVYGYALNAFYSVLVVSDRIPTAERKEFFLRAHDILRTARRQETFRVTLYNRHKIDRIFLQKNYTQLLFRQTRAYKISVATYHRWKKKTKLLLRKMKWEIAKILRDQHVKHPEIFDRILGPVPRADVVFESYWGEQFADSPKYLYKYLKQQHPEIRCAFAIKPDVSTEIDKMDCLRWKSHHYRVAMKRAKVMINNNNFTPDTVKSDDQIFIQTFHGIPLKKIGTDVIGYRDGGSQNWTALVQRCQMWDYVVSSGMHHTETLRGAFQTNATFLEVGSPRTDCLQSPSFRRKWRTDMRSYFGIHQDARIILYAPTWRKSSKNVLLAQAELTDLLATVPDDVHILYRGHHFAPEVTLTHPRILNATDYPDSQHLCAASDLLITDYSSIAFDFVATGRPAFFYVPDYTEYENARGLYIDMKTQMARLVFDQLFDLFETCAEALIDPRQAQSYNKELRDMFLEAESPDSCKYVVEKLILPHLKK